MISLRPGTYEVGREDGSIDPFLIVVDERGLVGGGTREAYELFCEALRGGPGWWFRYIYIPDFCPVIDEEGGIQ